MFVDAISTMNKPLNIWIIEDEELLRDSLEQLISSTEGLQLGVSAGSMEEALQSLVVSHAPDVILSDIGLPGMSGIEGLTEIKKQWPDVEIIMLTVYEDDERVLNAIKAGASGYLLKRTPAPKILESIHEVVDGGAPITSSIARKVLRIMSQAPSEALNPLTKRETEILRLLVEGHTHESISKRLFISRFTVGTHVKNIYKKLQVTNRSTAVAKAFQQGLV